MGMQVVQLPWKVILISWWVRVMILSLRHRILVHNSFATSNRILRYALGFIGLAFPGPHACPLSIEEHQPPVILSILAFLFQIFVLHLCFETSILHTVVFPHSMAILTRLTALRLNFGYKRFKDNDHYNSILGFFLSAEWTHNHLSFPIASKQSYDWWEIDVVYWVVKLLFELGWLNHVTLADNNRVSEFSLANDLQNDRIFEGLVRHGRSHPVQHYFEYKVYFMFSEISSTRFDKYDTMWFWSSRCWNLGWIKWEDYLSKNQCLDILEAPLSEEEKNNSRVFLMTHWRYFGFTFNPVSYYFIYGSGNKLIGMISEVHNTPWGEKCWYPSIIASERTSMGNEIWYRDKFQKKMHVSPFMEMDYRYLLDFTDPASESFAIVWKMVKDEATNPKFFASFRGQSLRVTQWNLIKVLMQYPLMTVQVVLGIYRQAWSLWFKIPFYDHPNLKLNQENKEN